MACDADVFANTAIQVFRLALAKPLGAVAMTSIQYLTISSNTKSA